MCNIFVLYDKEMILFVCWFFVYVLEIDLMSIEVLWIKLILNLI